MYESFFGLDPPPFRLLPNPHFYLDDGQFGAVLAQLIGGLEAGEPCLLLTGPAGSGKTATVQRMRMLLDGSRWAVGSMVACAGVAGQGVLQSAVHAFDLASADWQPGPALDRWLSSRIAQGGRALLVVDEAEHLDDSALRQLAERLSTPPATPGLQLCLVGERVPAGLAAAVRDGSVPPVAVHCRLHPLDAVQSRDYVLHRLRRAGWTGRPSFDCATTDAIHCRSAGIPRRIHLIADSVLLQLAMDAVDVATAAAVEAADDRRTVDLQGLAPSEARMAGSGTPLRASADMDRHPDACAEAAPPSEPSAPLPTDAANGSRVVLRVAAVDSPTLLTPEGAAPRGPLAGRHGGSGPASIPVGRAWAPRRSTVDGRRAAAGAVVVGLAGVGMGWWLGVGGAVQPASAPGSAGLETTRAAAPEPIGGLSLAPGSVTPATYSVPLARAAPAPHPVPAELIHGAEPIPAASPPPAALPRAVGLSRTRASAPVAPTTAAPAPTARAAAAPCAGTAEVLGFCEPAAARSPTPPMQTPPTTAVPATDPLSPDWPPAALPEAPCEPTRAVLGLCER